MNPESDKEQLRHQWARYILKLDESNKTIGQASLSAFADNEYYPDEDIVSAFAVLSQPMDQREQYYSSLASKNADDALCDQFRTFIETIDAYTDQNNQIWKRFEDFAANSMRLQAMINQIAPLYITLKKTREERSRELICHMMRLFFLNYEERQDYLKQHFKSRSVDTRKTDRQLMRRLFKADPKLVVLAPDLVREIDPDYRPVNKKPAKKTSSPTIKTAPIEAKESSKVPFFLIVIIIFFIIKALVVLGRG